MKNSEFIFSLFAGSIVIALLFFSITTMIKKSFSVSGLEKLDSTQMIDDQKRRNQDVRDRQKRLMEDQQQKLRDSRLQSENNKQRIRDLQRH